MRITNEHNHSFTIAHVCVMLFKGLACLPYTLYLAPVSFCFISPCVAFIFNLALTPLCFALPYPACLTFGHAKKTKEKSLPPPKNPKLSLFFVEVIIVAWLLFDYIDTCMYIPHCLFALVELCKNLLPSQSFLLPFLSLQALSFAFD